MVTRVVQPDPGSPITQESGLMSDRFRLWVQLINNQSLIIGTGSPETVIAAEQGAFYMDDTGTPGSILYIKRDADVAGDKTKGWILV